MQLCFFITMHNVMVYNTYCAVFLFFVLCTSFPGLSIYDSIFSNVYFIYTIEKL
jgi:hypothetical protein